MPKDPRICIATTSYPRFNGDEAGIFVERLVQAFGKNGLSGFVLVPQDGSEPSETTSLSFHIERFRYGVFKKGSLAFGSGIVPNIRKNPLIALQIPGFLLCMAGKLFRKRHSYDLVHANWLGAAVAAWLSHLLTRTPYVITIRGEDAKLVKNSICSILLKPVLHSAAFVTTVNEAFQISLHQSTGLPTSKIVAIPNGVETPILREEELEAFANTKGLSRSEKYLIFVGRVIPLKRIEIAIDMLLLPELSSHKLLVCGLANDNKYFEQLKEKISQLKLAHRIIFLGSVPPSEVPYYLSLSDYYVSASEYEGRSNSILEALSIGKIVLASNIPGHAELITDGVNGILFDPQDFSSLRASLDRLKNDLAFNDELVKKGKSSISQCTWDNTARRYHDLFQRAL